MTTHYKPLRTPNAQISLHNVIYVMRESLRLVCNKLHILKMGLVRVTTLVVGPRKLRYNVTCV